MHKHGSILMFMFHYILGFKTDNLGVLYSLSPIVANSTTLLITPILHWKGP